MVLICRESSLESAATQSATAQSTATATESTTGTESAAAESTTLATADALLLLASTGCKVERLDVGDP